GRWAYATIRAARAESRRRGAELGHGLGHKARVGCPSSKLMRMGEAAPAPRQLVGIGSSAGGIDAVSTLVGTLSPSFPAPIIGAQHLDPSRFSHLQEILARKSNVPVRTVQDREALEDGVVYVVPADRHVEISD